MFSAGSSRAGTGIGLLENHIPVLGWSQSGQIKDSRETEAECALVGKLPQAPASACSQPSPVPPVSTRRCGVMLPATSRQRRTLLHR